MREEEYKKTVKMLLEILPYALEDNRVALKGGTAINLFHRNFPRISIDIDLCYLPLEDRETTFQNVQKILAELKNKLEKMLGFAVSASNPLNGKKETKLVASKDGIGITIEPNFILRSSLFPAVDIELAPNAVIEFNKKVKARCLNIADAYGGKICAALDRQHPRDLFDIKFLLENEGITTDVKDSFIFYLISHNRPINELLNPNFKDISYQYMAEFLDMAKVEIELGTLLKAREDLVRKIMESLTENDKKFLISFVSNRPDWSLVRNSKIKDYPSVMWKMMNQEKMDVSKKNEYVKKIEDLFIGK